MGEVTVLPPNKGGRPAYVPTDKDRSLVRWLAVNGTYDTVIAGALGISHATLRRTFGRELRSARDEADARVQQTLYQAATSAIVYATDPKTGEVLVRDGRPVVAEIRQAGITACIWYQKRRLAQENRDAERRGEKGSAGITLLLLPGSENL